MKIEINNQDTLFTIDTYQTFTGGDNEDMMLEGFGCSRDILDFDYNHNEIVKCLSQASFEYISGIVSDSDIINEMRFLRHGSPKFYNYSSDYYVFEIDYNKIELDDFIKDNQQKYNEYVSGQTVLENEKELYKITFYLDTFYNKQEYLYYMQEVEGMAYYENVKVTISENATLKDIMELETHQKDTIKRHVNGLKSLLL